MFSLYSLPVETSLDTERILPGQIINLVSDKEARREEILLIGFLEFMVFRYMKLSIFPLPGHCYTVKDSWHNSIVDITSGSCVMK